MGNLSIDGYETELDDRTLAHIRVVITNKLRTGRSLTLTWTDSKQNGGGATSVLLHAASHIRFHFADALIPQLNREWLTRLAKSADGPEGLVPENVPEAHPTRSATLGTRVSGDRPRLA
jgi:hypothetical protein